MHIVQEATCIMVSTHKATVRKCLSTIQIISGMRMPGRSLTITWWASMSQAETFHEDNSERQSRMIWQHAEVRTREAVLDSDGHGSVQPCSTSLHSFIRGQERNIAS